MQFHKFLALLLLISTISCKQTKTIDSEAELEHILSQLTLKEKVDLCHAQSKFSSKGVARLGIPEIWMSDGPHGIRPEIAWDSWNHAGWTNDSCTAFPALTCLAATFNPDLSYIYGKAIGEEARYRKKDILLGPGVNIYRTPLNGRNFEYMGEDPYLASRMVVPYIKGVQENGVAACLKHFALNNQEKWRGHINVNVSERALREIYLPAFKASVEEGGLWTIMGAYNKFRGQHCCHNEYLNNKILKGEWGFDGVIISDWSGVHDTYEAAHYGLDIEMGTWTDGLHHTAKNAYDNYFLAQPFYNKLKSGEYSEELVNDKARRILRLMHRTNMNKNKPLGAFANEEHFAAARKIAQEGIVLLKNENNFFPINPNNKQTIAVIGENAVRSMTVGGGSSELKTQHEISPLDGIKHRFKNSEVTYSKGYAATISNWQEKERDSGYDQDSLKHAAIELAKKSDIVIFIGGLNKNYHQDSEGADRLSYGLPYGQDELIQALQEVNKQIGVIIISGNGYSMPWINNVRGIMQAWYLGSQAGNAIADVVSGDINPSGKLPFSIQVKLEDIGAHAFDSMSYPGNNIDQHYYEDIFVGYRWHEKKQIEPLFAFGFGLSYSKFSIENCSTNKSTYNNKETLNITCKLINNSNIDGAEVIQVYIGKKNSKIVRAPKELKNFSKVRLTANSSKQLTLPVKIEDLKYWNEDMNDWDIEKGEYFVAIGNSSNNISKEITFSVQ